MRAKAPVSKLILRLLLLFGPFSAYAGEADLALPRDRSLAFRFPGVTISSGEILWIGIAVCLCGIVFGIFECMKLKALPHSGRSMIGKDAEAARVAVWDVGG